MSPRSRPATYNTAIRIVRLYQGLLERPYGWSFSAIGDELGISERTLLRYIAACRRDLVDATGAPLLQAIRRGDRRVLRFSDKARAPDSTSYQALAYYFALTVFQFLDGTVLKDGVTDLWERFYRALPAAQQGRLAHLDRKFYSIPYAVKDYHAHDETLDAIVRCLIDQRTMRIDYAGLWGEEHVHDFDPYTLAMYRGGLYLIGRSHVRKRIIYLAVERIRTAERLEDHFAYPPRYTPEKHTEGMFGIVEGEETPVELLLLNSETTALLSSRRIHPTQRFTGRPDGTTLLTMRVRGTSELKNWIMSLGPYVRVLAPDSLREEVGAAHAQAAALYR